MENDVMKQEWVDVYRPIKLKDYVLSQQIRGYFDGMIKSRSPQNCTFAGPAGSGKTTLAKVLANEFDAETLFIPCATQGTLDVLRTKITEFCNALSMDGKIKIVILDEVDSASSGGDNNFQKGLRTVIEAAQSDTRFILTCNYIGKVIPPILSRCPLIQLYFDKKDLVGFIKKILDAEKVKYDKESLKQFIEESFKFYPDCRRIVKYLQMCCNSGTLVVEKNVVSNSSSDDLTEEIVKRTLAANDLLSVRKFYLGKKDQLGDLVEAGSKLFNYVADNDLATSDGILRLSDMLYALNVVVDKEPTYFGMLTALRKHMHSKAS